jgi:hypothetical protein
MIFSYSSIIADDDSPLEYNNNASLFSISLVRPLLGVLSGKVYVEKFH